MSTVLERFRNLSTYEWFNTALLIRKEVTLLVSSAAMPKSYRFTFAVPMVETARALVSALVMSDAFYPNSEQNAIQRRNYMTLAIGHCEQLQQDLQCLLDMGFIKVSRIERISTMLDRDIALIKGARKGVKVVNTRKNA